MDLVYANRIPRVRDSTRMEKEKRGSVAPPEAGLEYFGGAFPAWNASKNPRIDYILNMVYKQNALIPSSRRNEEDHHARVSHAQGPGNGYIGDCLVYHQLIHYFIFGVIDVRQLTGKPDPVRSGVACQRPFKRF